MSLTDDSKLFSSAFDAPDRRGCRVSDTLAERGETYGDYAQLARLFESILGPIWSHLGGAPWVHKMTPEQRHAIAMIATKLARIVNGSPSHADNWLDIAGYAKLIADQLAKKP